MTSMLSLKYSCSVILISWLQGLCGHPMQRRSLHGVVVLLLSWFARVGILMVLSGTGLVIGGAVAWAGWLAGEPHAAVIEPTHDVGVEHFAEDTGDPHEL